MTALLTDNLPLLAGAPNGIKKLRELILELAVRGKLVPQDPNDEPASELLIRIAEEKARLVAEGKIKKQKALTAIAEEDQPFELPAGWAWAGTATLTLLITDGTHHTPTYISSGVPFISVKDIDGTTISFDNCKYISQEEHVAINARCNPELGDILLCRIGTLGRPTIVDTMAPFSLFVSVGLLKLPKKTEISRYFHCVLSSPLMYRQYDQIKAGGSHTNKLNLGDIPRLLVPVPPLAEQHRIVAKVDELMALCDRLEAQQADADSAHTQLVQALLNSLTQASALTARDGGNAGNAGAISGQDFAQSWQRLAEHFHTLFTTESSIDALKQTLLQLAVMGKLVPQDPNDEPASALLARLAIDANKYAKEQKIAPPKPDPISASSLPGLAPPGWEWTRLCSIFRVITDGDHQAPPRAESGVPFLTIGNITKGRVDFSGCRFVPQSYFDSVANYRKPALGDILYTVVGATYGRPVFVDSAQEFCVQRHVAILKCCEQLDVRFMCYLLSSPEIYDQATNCTTGTAQPTIPLRPLRNFLLRLPPLAEQHRIVAKVDQLMALCDQLKSRLTQARQLNEQLASTLVEQAVA